MSADMKRMLALANQGDPRSQFNLGVLYGNLPQKIGTETAAVNRATSIKWLMRAAQQGLSSAQARLARLYADGPRTLGTEIRACTWFLLAMADLRGAYREDAQSRYDQVAARLSPDQHAKARHIAELMIKKRQDRSAPADLARETMNAWRL